MKRIREYEEKEKFLLDLEYEFVKEFIMLRKENGLTQEQLAKEANIIRETVAKIETQVVSPTISTIIKILGSIGYTLRITEIEEVIDETNK